MESVNYTEFEALSAHAADNVLAFADFTKWAEHLFKDSADQVALQVYQNAWFELEVVNAVALDQWEMDGRPGIWDVKWKERFLKDAEETVDMVRTAAQQLIK